MEANSACKGGARWGVGYWLAWRLGISRSCPACPAIPIPVRLDKWLWAARFYKTRSLASEAIGGGKVQVNGDRAKRARALHVGDEIRVRQGPYEYR